MWRHLWPLFTQTQCHRCLFQQGLRVDLLGREIFHDLTLETVRTKGQLPTGLAISSQRRETLFVAYSWFALQRFLVHSSPLSSTTTDTLSKYWNPSSWQCLSHMNLASCHPAELLTALGMKLRSSLFSSRSTSISFSWHDPHACVSADSFRANAFLFAANSQQCSQNLGPLQTPSGPNQPRAFQRTAVLSLKPVQLHLQSVGSLTLTSDPNQPRK